MQTPAPGARGILDFADGSAERGRRALLALRRARRRSTPNLGRPRPAATKWLVTISLPRHLLAPREGVDEVRHELAHAWDHVRDGKVRRLDNYKGAQLKKEVLAPATFASETNKKRVTVAEPAGAGTKQVGLSIKDTFDRFIKRPVQDYWSFRNSKTDPEHVTSNVKEFYAEGYSVFHGGDEDAQAQLLCAAPELYQLLEKEALAEKLAVPDRKKLDANNASNKRTCS